MKILKDFVKILLWMASLYLLLFFITSWVTSQRYSFYSTLTGLLLFIAVTYISYRELKT